jgi:hypothetical protein
MQMLRYCWTITMKMVFSMWFMLRCYKPDSLKQWVSCQQFSWVKWHEVAGWWVREFSCQFNWKSTCEEKNRWLVWNGQQPGIQLVEGWQLRRVLHGRLWQENLWAESWISLGRSRCQETAIGDCNRLRTLVCVCQWSIKCSSKWCIQVVNKSNIQSIPYL